MFGSRQRPYRSWTRGGPIGWTDEANTKGPILGLGRVGAVGTLHAYHDPVWATDNVLVITPKPRVIFDFLQIVLLSINWTRVASGSSQPLLTQRVLKEQAVTVPTLAVQADLVQRAKEILTRIDSVAQRGERARRLVRRFNLALSRAVATGAIAGQLDSALRGAANGWPVVALGDVTENFDARRIPLKADTRRKRQGEYPYYGASGVIDSIDDYLFDGTYLLVAEDGANLLSRSTPIAFQASGAILG